MYEYHATCVRVVDGDTFDFDVDLGFHITHRIRVRLRDVDTPEMNSKNAAEREHAREAMEFATNVLIGAGDPFPVVIRTEKDKIGIYGRYTASVLTPNGDLATLLTEKGLLKLASYPGA